MIFVGLFENAPMRQPFLKINAYSTLAISNVSYSRLHYLLPAMTTCSQQNVSAAHHDESLSGVALRGGGKSFCARCIRLSLEQAKETAGIGWGIVMTPHVSHGAFTEDHTKGGIRS